MLVAKEAPLGLPRNEVNDGLDQCPASPVHHLPGIVLSTRLVSDDKGSHQAATCTKGAAIPPGQIWADLSLGF